MIDNNTPQTTSVVPKTFRYMWAFGLNPVCAISGNTFAYLMNTFLCKARKRNITLSRQELSHIVVLL